MWVQNLPLAANEINACACRLILVMSVCWLLIGKRTNRCSRKSSGVTDEIFHFNLFNTISSHCWKDTKDKKIRSGQLNCYKIDFFFAHKLLKARKVSGMLQRLLRSFKTSCIDNIDQSMWFLFIESIQSNHDFCDATPTRKWKKKFNFFI